MWYPYINRGLLISWVGSYKKGIKIFSSIISSSQQIRPRRKKDSAAELELESQSPASARFESGVAEIRSTEHIIIWDNMHSTSLKALDHCITAYACFAQTVQHENAKGVLAFLLIMVVVVVTTLVLHLRVDQNGHAEQVQGNIFMPKSREVAIDIPNIVSLPAPPSMKSHRPLNNSQDANSPNPTIETSFGSLKLIPIITHKKRVEIDMPTASSSLPLAYPLPKNPHVPKTGTCSSGHSQIYQVKEVEILDSVALILSKTPHIDTSTSLVGISQSLADEVVNNDNAVVRDQSQIDMSDTASLLHQDATPAEATSSFGIENPINLSPEGEQTSGVPSQSTAQTPPPIPGNDALTPPPVPVPEAEEEPDLKIELKVATWVTIISAGGIVGVISGVIGNEKALLPRKLLFKGFMSLNYTALVSSIGQFMLIKIRPNIPGFERIVKFIMWIAIGSLVYSLGLATCILFPAKAEIVLILVVPLVLVGLVGILSFARRE